MCWGIHRAGVMPVHRVDFLLRHNVKDKHHNCHRPTEFRATHTRTDTRARTNTEHALTSMQHETGSRAGSAKGASRVPLLIHDHRVLLGDVVHEARLLDGVGQQRVEAPHEVRDHHLHHGR